MDLSDRPLSKTARNCIFLEVGKWESIEKQGREEKGKIRLTL